MTLQGFMPDRYSHTAKMEHILKSMNSGWLPAMPKLDIPQSDVTQKLLQQATSMLANMPAYQPIAFDTNTQNGPQQQASETVADSNKADMIRSLLEVSIRETVNKYVKDNCNKSVQLNGELKITSDSTTTVLKFSDSVSETPVESPIKSAASKRKSSIPTRLPVVDKHTVPLLFNNSPEPAQPQSSDSGVLDLSNSTSVSEPNQTAVKQEETPLQTPGNMFNLPLFNYLQRQLSNNALTSGANSNQTPNLMPTLLPKPQSTFFSSAPNSPMKTLKRVSSGPRGPRTHTTRKNNGSSRRFPCNQCRDEFNSLHSLEEHTLSVHGSYRCHICHAQFTQRSNLQRHALKHVGFKPFECRVCTKAYYRKDHLIRHMEMGHPGYDPRQNITVHLTSSESLEYLNRTFILPSDGSLPEVPKLCSKKVEDEEGEKVDVVNDSHLGDECETMNGMDEESHGLPHQRLSNSTNSLSIDMMDTYDSNHVNSFNISSNSSGNSPVQSPERASSTSYHNIDLPSPQQANSNIT